MEKQPIQLLKIEKAHVKPASKMLARAFRDDPVEKYAYPELGGYDPRLPHAFEVMLRIGMKYGYAFTTSPRLEGVAVWAKIEKPEYPFWRMLLAGVMIPAMRMGWGAGRRMQALSSKLEKKHEQIISGIHWYLQLIGVEPEFQGKGYASRLIRGMLPRIDEESLPCYLETELEENTLIYGHFGFQTLEVFDIPDTPLKMWLMLRPALSG